MIEKPTRPPVSAPRLACALALAVLAVTPLFAGEASPPDSSDSRERDKTLLASRLQRTLAELRRAREERYRLEARHRAEEKSLQARIGELQARGKAEQVRLDHTKKRIEETKRELEAKQSETARARSVLESAVKAIAKGAARLRFAILESIPFRKEERLDPLDAVLERPGNEPARDLARRFQQILEHELLLGSTSEAYRARVDLGENHRPLARCLRLGLVTLAFITEDGRTTGLFTLDRDGTGTWRTDLGFLERWGLKRGMEILERRRPPVFIRFPLDFARLRDRKKAPAAPDGAKSGEGRK